MSQYASRQNADAVQIQADMDEQGVSYGYTGIIQSDSAVKANKYMDSNMNQVVITTVQRGVGATLYKKQDKWVDAKLGEQAGEEPEITIEFDTEEYWAIITDLVSQDRQWILANRGDVYFMNHSKRVLVRNPK